MGNALRAKQCSAVRSRISNIRVCGVIFSEGGLAGLGSSAQTGNASSRTAALNNGRRGRFMEIPGFLALYAKASCQLSVAGCRWAGPDWVPGLGELAGLPSIPVYVVARCCQLTTGNWQLTTALLDGQLANDHQSDYDRDGAGGAGFYPVAPARQPFRSGRRSSHDDVK